ncbi:BREX-1 system adenine-specific DNA-methyltransferase PglX [Treponema primitia]|uniref:BREX-1 system adenine-specific DNA-methyltransferase PglX n=1 Tax=Treponema primitia TaxID=88058 RepID=UPI0039817EBA
MDKNSIKNFAIWARNQLRKDVIYKARLIGITDKGIGQALPQSVKGLQIFDIGNQNTYKIDADQIKQREMLISVLNKRKAESGYEAAFESIVEEVAYTWFNRLIAIRFMEVNDYLPSGMRVLSAAGGKLEPELVSRPFDSGMTFSQPEKNRIAEWKDKNQSDELFAFLFIKQCNDLNRILPGLFEKINAYSELLLNISYTDTQGIIYKLTHDISEDDFKEAVEIIGWLYQYYNTELKDETFALLKKNIKITKERIPAATQLFTPDWIVRYMVENSLGRLWIEGHPNDALKVGWKYYLDEAEQEADVQKQLEEIRKEYRILAPADIKVIDPCMGSGHILVYVFDVLMQIYESQGYNQRDAAKSILENNLYGLDIDDRAYQLAYFAVMMKVRQYNRRVLNEHIEPHLYAIEESNDIDRKLLQYFGAGMAVKERQTAYAQINNLLDTFKDAKEYGSILKIGDYNWSLLKEFVEKVDKKGFLPPPDTLFPETLPQPDLLPMEFIPLEDVQRKIKILVATGQILSQKYDAVVTNPPYMSSSNMSTKLNNYLKINFKAGKNDLFSTFIEQNIFFTKKNRFISMITMHSWLFLSRYEIIRKDILDIIIDNLVHLGAHAFEEINGEVVQTVAFSLRKTHLKNYNGLYSRLIQYSSELEKISHFSSSLFICNQEKFNNIVDNIIAYWISDKIFLIFKDFKSVGDISDSRQGIATGNNDMFLRFWYEVKMVNINLIANNQDEMNGSGCLYVPYNKGGSFRRWYGNREYVIKFNKNNYEKLLNTGNHLPSRQYYYCKGITWNDVSTSLFCARYIDNGFIFDAAGPTCFYNNEYYMLGYFNSNVFQTFLNIICQGLHYSTGHIPNAPFINKYEKNVSLLAEKNIKLSKFDWDSFETSWDFKRHPLV